MTSLSVWIKKSTDEDFNNDFAYLLRKIFVKTYNKNYSYF